VKQALSPLEDSRLPQLPGLISTWLRLGREVRMLAYRVGSRAIFRICDGTGPIIVKVYRKDRQLLPRWTALSSDATAARSVPRVLDWDPDGKALSIEYRPGISLNERWLAGHGETGDGGVILGVLEWLVKTPLPPGFPTHTARDEIRILEERLPVFERTLKEPPPRARALVARVTKELAAEKPRPSRLCHRDFHDKQLLLDRDRVSLIDLDLAAAGPPALDAGNILAHLRLRSLKGASLPWREIAGHISPSLLKDGLAGTLHLWTAATLLRLALIYARRRRAPDLVDRLLDSVEAALDRRGEWSDLL
jgi:Ser/Thr protein kinase RdoA (MazF antagonist)